MTDTFEIQEIRSSGELWSQICSDLPQNPDETNPETTPDFHDSFQPVPRVDDNLNCSLISSPIATWEPMEDSEVYIASLENRLKKLKGQATDVTSREILRSLTQAKKECWDRFLHDPQTSELFQSGDMDESAVEHFKRWLVPEKVAISAEELEYLLRPPHSTDTVESNHTCNEEDMSTDINNCKVDETHRPEK